MGFWGFGERAQLRIKEIQQQNRDKSMAKIKELTEQHKKEGKSKKDKIMFDDMEGKSDDEDDEESKTDGKK